MPATDMKLRHLLSRPIVWITGLSLLWAVLIAFNLAPDLRGSFGWQWPYEPVLDLRRIAPLILGVLLYIPVALRLLRGRSSVPLLLWTMLGGIGLSLAASYVREDVFFRFYTITVSGVASGYHTTAMLITDLGETLRRWPEFTWATREFSSHVVLSPPGMVLAYYAASAFLAGVPALAAALAAPLRLLQCGDMALMSLTNARLASAWLGILVPLWGSLTVLALYRLGRYAFGVEPARWAVLWWPLVPSLLIFAPLPYTFFALPSMIMIGLLLVGLCRNRPLWVAAAGVVMSALTFLSFALLPLVVLAGLLALGIYWTKARSPAGRQPWHWPLRMGLWFALGLASVWVVFGAVSGLAPWELLRAGTRDHLALERPYGPWLVLHLNDFFMFTGWPLVLMAGAGVWRSARRLARGAAPAVQDVVILSAALTLLLLDLSGTMRGESGRILLYFSPLILLGAAGALDRDRASGRLLTVLQGLVLVVMVVCMSVLSSGLSPAPSAPPVGAAPAELSFAPNGAVFDGAARLNGFAGRVEMQPGGDGRERAVLRLWLKWEPVGRMDAPYYLSLIPVAPGGQAAPAATLLQPFRQAYPTTCWKPGDGEMQDRVEVPLPTAEQGDWWVSLALVDGQTGRAASVSNPDGSTDRQVGIGPFR
jgi:hypothetical protein